MRGVSFGHTDYVDDTDFWSLGTARGWRGVYFVAAQEIRQDVSNLGAMP